jgi:hypothetical protein
MGRVFSFNEIEARQVPTIEAISGLARFIKTLAENNESIRAGVILGSVMYGRHTRRSDVDFVVIHDASQAVAAHKLFRLFYEQAAQVHVPLEVISISDQLAAASAHDIGLALTNHLSLADKSTCVVKQHPCELLSPHVLNAREDILNYLCRKAADLERRQYHLAQMSGHEYFKYLQKLLESPIHIARRMLQLRRESTDDSKPRVVSQYAEIVNRDLAELFERLQSLDAEYSAELERQLEHPSEAAYKTMLKRIEQVIPDAVTFAQQNLLAVSRPP